MNNTLIKGLQLLELLARSKTQLGISELANISEIGRSNVHRLLQALVELGYVRQNESNGAYSATLKIWELGTALESSLPIRSAALAPMEKLLRDTRESIHLSVLDRSEIVYIHKLDSPEPVRAYSEIGGRAPAHCVATGKAILAWQSEAFLADLSRRLKRYTEKTIVDPTDFLRELDRVRANGYAVNRGEWRETVWGIGAAIRSPEGSVLAAIGISGPSNRVKPASVKHLAAEVVAAAAAVEANLARG